MDGSEPENLSLHVPIQCFFWPGPGCVYGWLTVLVSDPCGFCGNSLSRCSVCYTLGLVQLTGCVAGRYRPHYCTCCFHGRQHQDQYARKEVKRHNCCSGIETVAGKGWLVWGLNSVQSKRLQLHGGGHPGWLAILPPVNASYLPHEKNQCVCVWRQCCVGVAECVHFNVVWLLPAWCDCVIPVWCDSVPVVWLLPVWCKVLSVTLFCVCYLCGMTVLSVWCDGVLPV